jgi:CheY-like chemotaxis protein
MASTANGTRTSKENLRSRSSSEFDQALYLGDRRNMGKILVVDDDESMRRLIRLNLGATHEVALSLALEHKPDVILLDLRMPKYSGFELCRTFTSLSTTQLIPVFVISGEAGAKTKEFCRELGAVVYFEKPVDFDRLLASLADCLKSRRSERRCEVRVRLRVPLKFGGTDASGASFQILTTAENVGRNSFLCACAASLARDSVVEVTLIGSPNGPIGRAKVVRTEDADTEYPRYALRFLNPPDAWVLN